MVSNRDNEKLKYGILEIKGDGESSIREEDIGEKTFIKGLFWVNPKNLYDNNIIDFIKEADGLGYKCGQIIGIYLSSANEGKRYDYYEGWMEIY